MRRLVLLLGVAACGRSGARPHRSASPLPATQDLSITKPEPSGPTSPLAASFGIWDESGRFVRTTKVNKVEGQTFGWRIKTRCTGPVRFREVLRMPSPGDWTFTPDEMPGTTISDDQTTTTTVDYAACKQGWVEHVWNVAAGDPAGTYVITVQLDGYTQQTFRPKLIGQ